MYETLELVGASSPCRTGPSRRQQAAAPFLSPVFSLPRCPSRVCMYPLPWRNCHYPFKKGAGSQHTSKLTYSCQVAATPYLEHGLLSI